MGTSKKKAPNQDRPKAKQPTVKVKTPRADGTMSGVDAAEAILKAAGEPMTCKAMVEKAQAKGLWNPKGKTPAATLYSAILREIDTKPGESRFTKTGHGLFGLTSK